MIYNLYRFKRTDIDTTLNEESLFVQITIEGYIFLLKCHVIFFIA